MKILKFLVGGAPSFQVIANPFAAPAESSTTSSGSGSSKKSGLLSDTLLNKLYTEGIPTDVDLFVRDLSKYEAQEQWGLGVSPAAIRNLEARANRIILQSKYLEKAESFAENNNSIGEVAVGSRGQLYVAGESGEIKAVSMKQYDPEKHGPALTVGELIEQRKFNPSEAYDVELTQAINSNLGMQKINEYIQKIIQTVGSSETTSEAYTDLAGYIGKLFAKRPTEAQLKNLLQLADALQGLGPDAIFKNKEILKSKNLKEAFDYILSVLPRDMKILLAGRWVANGGDLKNSENYMNSIIAGALNASNDIVEGNYINYENDINKAAGTVAGSKEHEKSMTSLELLVLGSLGKLTYNIVSKNHPDIQFTLMGNGIGLLADADNKIVGESILSDALAGGLGALIDSNNIFFGDLKISKHALDKFVYAGDEVINIWAPVTANGEIDFGKLALYEEIKSQIKNNPRLTLEDIAQLMALIGINGTLDSNGNFVGRDPNMEQFIVMTGYTSDEVVDDDENEFSYKLSGDTKRDALEKIKYIYGKANKGMKGDAVREFPTGWFDMTTDIIAAPIFMKLGRTARFDAGTIVGNGARIQSQSYSSLLANDQAHQINKPSSSIL